ncbi:MAG: RNA-binding S4 domain-containing protein [Ruminococcaceae bacterium]|nr:RNA-binding S4 domain-containing protein [Oscillospiraceae bacterium]
MEKIYITTPYITLGQLLKFADVVSDGADAKILITEGYVKLNGNVETRRGKKIYNNDEVVVEYEGEKIMLKVINE